MVQGGDHRRAGVRGSHTVPARSCRRQAAKGGRSAAQRQETKGGLHVAAVSTQLGRREESLGGDVGTSVGRAGRLSGRSRTGPFGRRPPISTTL